MFEEWNEVLKKTSMFIGLDSEDLSTLINCLKPKICNYKKNEYISIAGDDFDGIGIMLRGEAAVIKENAAGNRVIMAMLKAGDMFGEMAGFSGTQVWPATVHAQQACTVFFMPPQRIIGECEKLCPWHRVLIQNMLKIISQKALNLNRKVEYLVIKSMRGKISTFLLEQWKKTGNTTFMLPMKRNELADFLNVSRPSMSREMSRMKNEGVIDFHMSSVRIMNIEALKGMVQ